MHLDPSKHHAVMLLFRLCFMHGQIHFRFIAVSIRKESLANAVKKAQDQSRAKWVRDSQQDRTSSNYKQLQPPS